MYIYIKLVVNDALYCGLKNHRVRMGLKSSLGRMGRRVRISLKSSMGSIGRMGLKSRRVRIGRRVRISLKSSIGRGSRGSVVAYALPVVINVVALSKRMAASILSLNSAYV